MPVDDQEFRKNYQEFAEESGEEFATRRLEKQTLPELLSEDTVTQLKRS